MESIQKTIKTLLNNPTQIKSKSQAKQLHAQIIKTLSSPSLQTWKSIIKCYSSNACFFQSLKCFVRMRAMGIHPDHNVFPSVLKACTHLMCFKLGESVHGSVIRVGLEFDVFVGNALLSMYSKSQRGSALQVFDESPERKLYHNGYNNYNNGYKSCPEVSRNCRKPSALSQMSDRDRRNVQRFSVLQVFDESPERRLNNNDDNIYESYLKVSENCRNPSALNQMSNMQDQRNVQMRSVRKVFETMPEKDAVSYNTLVLGYAQNNMYNEAMMMIREMCNYAKLKPDAFTLSNVLPVVAEYMDVWKGKEIHGCGIRHGFERNGFITSGLIDVYANCKMVVDSYRLFCSLPEKDCVSWCSMIAACVQNGLFDEGLKLFRQMLSDNIKPVPISCSTIIPACAHLTALPLGQQLHGYIIRHCFDDNMFISSSLVNMYAKCGNIKLAKRVFDSMKQHDLVSWTAMIMGCASHGYAHDAISLFKKMEMEGFIPNSVAFVAVLTACSHAGMVNEGLTFFNRMVKDHEIVPDFEHYACVADLLGRAGRLEDAFRLICSMPGNKTVGVWLPLLAACRVHKNVELAEKVVMQIREFDSENVGAYVLLSNVYFSVGRYKDAANVRRMLSKNMYKKEPACSWIRIGEKVHAFIAGDESHSNYDGMLNVLNIIFGQIGKEVYVADN